MKLITDLHIHGRYSRACSKELSFENLEKYARIKGLGLLGTADFTHPKWIEEIKKELTEDEQGILWTKNGFPFIWQTEISLIYQQDGLGRRIHHIILAPNREVAKQIAEALGKKGRLDYDGRPIFGFSSIDLVDMMMDISTDIEIIPAHAWTPWFSLYGSNSGFDSIKDCFKDQLKHVHAIETGLSSDPEMNWRLDELKNITIISNSDSHSFWPWRIGREANVFDVKKITYKDIIKVIRTREGFVETIEFFPEEGKYHYTGHRACNVCLHPKESTKLKDICPVCGRKLTVGVLQRVEKLANHEEGYRPEGAVPFKKLIPLSELIAGVTGSSVASQKTWKSYNELIREFGNEFNILLEASQEKLQKITETKIAEAIIKNREGKISVQPGYDGEYGKPLFNGEEKIKITKAKHQQKGLNEFF